MSEVRTIRTSKGEFSAFLATQEHLPQLIRLTHASFPDSFRFSKRNKNFSSWWSAVLKCGHVEVWALSEQTSIDGFILLLKDEERWSKEKFNAPSRRSEKLLLAIRYPLVALRNLRAKCTKFPEGFFHSTLEPHAPSQRLFIELVAVSPRTRGKGLGGELIRLGFERAAELGYEATYGRVDNANKASLKTFSKHGFLPVDFDHSGVLLGRERRAADLNK